MRQFKYILYIFSKSLMHQFKCVDNAINVHEFILNIPSFIYLLLNYIPITYDVILFIQFLSCIHKFMSNYFRFIILIISII